MRIIQRLGSDEQYTDEYINGLLLLKKQYPESYNEVWLATDYGFPPLAIHKAHASALTGIAERFRAAGVTVSLQLSNTIGHGEYMSSRDCSGLVYEGSPVRPMVGHGGEAAQYCFCFRDEALARYVTEELALYCTAVRPDYVWIDDDFRADNHSPAAFGCFCDDCIARFNEEQHTAYTRQMLVDELVGGDIRIREAFVAFNRRDLAALAGRMARAVHEVSPETSLALQNGFHGYTGGDSDFVFDGVRPYSKNVPAYRAGGGAYNDHDPNAIFGKVVDVMFQNSRLPQDVTLRVPEIENLPFVFSGKSPAGDMLESALQLATGNTGLSYSMMMRFLESPAYFGKHLSLLQTMRPYFEKLADVSAQTQEGGLYYAIGRKCHLRRYGAEEELGGMAKIDLHHADPLMRDGVPISFEDAGGTVILTASNAEAMTDEELKALLARPIITDGAAIAAIQKRGFDLGCEPRVIDPCVAGRYHEVFTKDLLNPADHATLAVSGFVPGGNEWRYTFDKIPEGARVLGYYGANVAVDIAKAPTVATFIFKTKEGGTVAVFGQGLFVGIAPKYAIDRLLNVADEIGGKVLPARVLSESQAFLYPRINAAGQTASVSVANATPGSDEITISLRYPAGTKFVYMSQYGKKTRLRAQKQDGRYVLKLPALPAYAVGTVFCE